jgi:Flp pilus assembly protein TadD/VanZ family protein
MGWSAGVAALALLAYLPWIGNPFHFDDRLSILGDVQTRSLDLVWKDLSRTVRVVTRLSYCVTHAVWGHDPRAYHAVDLALHLGASLSVGGLAFALARRSPGLGGARGAAAVGLAAGACFALHPLNSEAVFYASSRTDLLGALFGIGAAWALLRWADEAAQGAAGLRWAILAGIFSLLGWFSKESAVMGWWLGLLLAGWRLSQARVRGRLWGLLCLASVLGMLGLAAVHAGRNGLTVPGLLRGEPSPPWTYPEHLGIQVRAHAWYLLPRLLLPLRLSLSPGAPMMPASWPGAIPAGCAALLGGSLLAWKGWQRGGIASAAALAWAWWFLAQAVTTVVALSDPVSEHRSYLALAGPALLGGLLLTRLACALGRLGWGPWGTALLAVLAGLGAVRIHARGADFRSEWAIWRQVVRDAPAKPGARLNLGRAYDEEGLGLPRAVRQYGLALRNATPGFQAMILNNVGNIQIRQGNFGEAVHTYDEALKLSSGHPDIRMNRAIALAGLGRVDEGCRDLETLASENPQNGDVLRALGNILRGRKDPAGARRCFREALRAAPDLVDAYIDLALVEIEAGDPPAAAAAMEACVRRCGYLARVWDFLGYVRFAAGDLAGAESACRRALSMDAGAWRAQVTLAAILERRGDRAGALAAYRAALAADPGNPVLARAVEALEAGRREEAP